MKPFLSVIFILFFTTYLQSEVLTYEDIITKIYDLPALASLPAKGEKGALFSSYDRESRYDEKTDSYLRWRANDDGRGCVRKENGITVMADIKGPGVIWRMWSATVQSGKVKIFLDGKLVIDLPWKDYFNRKLYKLNFYPSPMKLGRKSSGGKPSWMSASRITMPSGEKNMPGWWRLFIGWSGSWLNGMIM